MEQKRKRSIDEKSTHIRNKQRREQREREDDEIDSKVLRNFRNTDYTDDLFNHGE